MNDDCAEHAYVTEVPVMVTVNCVLPAAHVTLDGTLSTDAVGSLIFFHAAPFQRASTANELPKKEIKHY